MAVLRLGHPTVSLEARLPKVALITGVNGQDGAYLARLLLDKGYAVHGAIRSLTQSPMRRLAELGVEGEIPLHELDLLDLDGINRLLDATAPDEIYNLAAQSFVSRSFDQAVHTSDVDALGVLRLLEVLRHTGSKARFYQASSSEMFGKVLETPQTELTPFYPRSPYGVAKAFAHFATVNYRESYGIHAVSGILFNHESPLRGADYVTRKITLGLVRIAAGQQEAIELGNLDIARDWGFAGDYVEGMWRMLQADTPDNYVLATGRTWTIRQFVERAAEPLGMRVAWEGSGLGERAVDTVSGRPVVTVSERFFRPADVDVVMGDPSKAERELGWRRTVDFPQLVAMMVEADARRVREGVAIY